jgi:hypothetical protein
MEFLAGAVDRLPARAALVSARSKVLPTFRSSAHGSPSRAAESQSRSSSTFVRGGSVTEWRFVTGVDGVFHDRWPGRILLPGGESTSSGA